PRSRLRCDFRASTGVPFVPGSACRRMSRSWLRYFLFFDGAFFAGAFLAAFLAGAFLATFLAGAFLAAFLAGAFFAAACLAGAFLAGAFLATGLAAGL